MAKNFLIELGTEELPPKQLRTLAEAFAANFESALNDAAITHQGVKWFATPRRLALKVTELAESQQDKVVEKEALRFLSPLIPMVTQQKQHKVGLAAMALLLNKPSD